jgi:hypothetical protein
MASSSPTDQISDLILARLPSDSFLAALSLVHLVRVFVGLLLCYILWCLCQSPPAKSKSKTIATEVIDNGGNSPCAEYMFKIPNEQYVKESDDFATSIIAVHGLGSNHETTWNYKGHTAEGQASNGTCPMWLRDFLPKEGLNARIIAFNHNSEWTARALSKSLEDHGYDLLLALEDKRKTSEVRIGHERKM